jgi:hypothetical protein
MTNWQISMLCLAVFIGAHFYWKLRPWHRVRTWLALAFAGVMGHVADYYLGSTEWLMASFILIDLAAAAVVLIRPAGVAQKAIGFGFAVMVLAHIGVLVATISGPINGIIYDDLNVRLGWAQFLCLLLWSCDDVGKAALLFLGFGGAVARLEALGGAGGR